MTSLEQTPSAEKSRFFDRCLALIDTPAWSSAVIDKMSSPEKFRESGDVAIVATDPDGTLKLAGYLIAGGGQTVYAFQGDVGIQEEREFWNFASANYIWLTPTIELRKRVATEVGGKAEGQSFKLAGNEMGADAFIDAILAPKAPKEKVRAPRKVKAVEAPIEGMELTMEVALVVLPEGEADREIASKCAVADLAQGVQPARVPAEKMVLVSDLSVGQTMSMF